jgi:hypothetical protein
MPTISMILLLRAPIWRDAEIGARMLQRNVNQAAAS